MINEPSYGLLDGRRDLEDIEGLTLLEDLHWNREINKWILKIKFELNDIPIQSELRNTIWYIQIDDNYPKGKIKILPAFYGGICYTYPHQSYNSYKEGDLWRQGNLCLDTQIKSLNRGINPSEIITAEERLYWHCLRALNWIKAAYENKLLDDGDDFELPVFPFKNDDLVVFNESNDTFKSWDISKSLYGVAELLELRNEPKILMVNEMSIGEVKNRVKANWGSLGNSSNLRKQEGFWILLKEIPILHAWQVPKTYKELNHVCLKQGIDITEIIEKFARDHRNNIRYILLIGFPIPNKVNGPDIQIQWQSIKLPAFTYKEKGFKGFSEGKARYKSFMNADTYNWVRDKFLIFSGNISVDWLLTQNWSEERLLSRGRLNKMLMESNVLLIGCGAIGSSIGEYLVRAGVKKITLMDGDVLESGNLVRHTLTLKEILEGKAEKLSERLTMCNPLVVVKHIGERLRAENIKEKNLNQYDLILDCTGENSLLELLEDYSFEHCKKIISVSVSRGAKRLYLYSSEANNFKFQKFKIMLESFADKDLAEYRDDSLPREGIGCWHPVFPAKTNDITLMSSIAVSYIEEIMKKNNVVNDFRVYEATYRDGVFLGVNKTEMEKEHECN